MFRGSPVKYRAYVGRHFVVYATQRLDVYNRYLSVSDSLTVKQVNYRYLLYELYLNYSFGDHDDEYCTKDN